MSLAVLALAGSVPIVVVFVLLVGFRWSAVRAMAVGWAIASALGLFLWQMDTVWWAASALYGALQAIEIIIIVFGAILLMNHLEGSGAVTTIRWHFTQITEDRRAQLLLIGLGFITLIEGAAGFGTPGALAAPLLIGLGFPPLAAAVFGLMFNAPQPPFGAAGTPVIGGIAAVIDENVLAEGQELPAFLEAVTGWTALFTGTALVFWGLLGVFLLAFWFGNEEERSFRGALRVTLPVAPLAVTLGILAGGTQAVVAWLFGPELPDIAAGFVILGAGVTLVRFGMFVPDETWTFPDRQTWSLQWFGGEKKKEEVEDVVQESTRTMPVIVAWTPYILVALILVVTRWPGLGIVGWLQQQSLDIPRILGEELSFSLRYLYLPGVVPFIPVALLTALIHRMRPATVAAAWRESAGQIFSPAITLIVAVSMTQVMIQSTVNLIGQPGMMEALSTAVARGAGMALPLVSPWIGTLGSFMTGSNTSSNILFSVLQHDAAADVGLSRTIIVALQNAGGGIGNMLSVLNVAAICGVIKMSGMESAILRKVLLPTIIFAIFAGIIGMILVVTMPALY